ncbi:MAG: tRNA (guanosine(46)-N7)-methyltransferase TrmB [Treponema sp.]|jgi:tRNA (guanine-N7-)-methyltransferase|nr:tRNA (guanosine(46)-N7)-methyltransferase TrmB [Treponema sp.]
MNSENAVIPSKFANMGIRSFVRRQGRISSAQKRSYETLYHLYGIKGGDDFLDGYEIFGNDAPLVIEIGFGMGRATAAIAHNNPGINYLGIEVHKPGIGRLLGEIERLELKNIRIAEGDAVEILEKRIKDETVSAFHIFFPDPWPKKRHHKRRLIARPFTDLLAAKLSGRAYIYMVSDWADYGDWALRELSSTPGLVNRYDAFAERQAWRPETEFERKGLDKNHEIRELYFEKR